MRNYYQAWRKTLPFTTILFFVLTLAFAIWSGFSAPTMVCVGFLILCILLTVITSRLSGAPEG